MFRVGPVASLLKACRPAAIPRRVRAVVVDAVNAVRWAWLWSHIASERLEAVAPLWNHVDPARAVTDEPSIVGIRASLLRATPRRILWRLPVRLGGGAGRSVRKVAEPSPTTATSRIAALQYLTEYYLLASAGTSTEPRGSKLATYSRNVGGSMDDDEIAERAASEIDQQRKHSDILARVLFNMEPCG